MEKTYEDELEQLRTKYKVEQLQAEHEQLKRFLITNPEAPTHEWEAALYRCTDIRDELWNLGAKAKS